MACPFFPAKIKLMPRSFDGPPKLTQNTEGEEVAMSHYRSLRDEIRVIVEKMPEILRHKEKG